MKHRWTGRVTWSEEIFSPAQSAYLYLLNKDFWIDHRKSKDSKCVEPGMLARPLALGFLAEFRLVVLYQRWESRSSAEHTSRTSVEMPPTPAITVLLLNKMNTDCKTVECLSRLLRVLSPLVNYHTNRRAYCLFHENGGRFKGCTPAFILTWQSQTSCRYAKLRYSRRCFI